MKTLFTCVLILLSAAACSREKMAFNPIIANQKTFNYTVDKGQFYVVTPKSGFAGDATAVLSVLVFGSAAYSSSYENDNLYGYDIAPIGNDMTEQMAREEGDKIAKQYNLADPADDIMAEVSKNIETKYSMKKGKLVTLKADKKGRPIKDAEIASANYLLNLTSSWQLENKLQYGKNYTFIYTGYLSLNDVRAFDAPKKYDAAVITDQCIFQEKTRFKYKEYLTDDAKILKAYIQEAKDYCTDYYVDRITHGDIGSDIKRVEK